MWTKEIRIEYIDGGDALDQDSFAKFMHLHSGTPETHKPPKPLNPQHPFHSPISSRTFNLAPEALKEWLKRPAEVLSLSTKELPAISAGQVRVKAARLFG